MQGTCSYSLGFAQIIQKPCIALFFPDSSALKCFVGRGNSSLVLPATAEEMDSHALSQDKDRAVFKIMECGRRGSDIAQFDRIAKNITDQVKKTQRKFHNNFVLHRMCNTR